MRATWFAAVVTAMLGVSMTTFAATGGPDNYGYTWADSAEFNIFTNPPPYTPIDLRGLGFVGDESVIRLDLPSTSFPTGFPFYGSTYSQLWLSSNGWISFVDPVGNAVPAPRTPPDIARPNGVIAFLWDDWTLDHVAPLANAGENDANDGFTITVRVADPVVTTDFGQIAITLFNSGAIQMIYRRTVSALLTSATTIGIEDAAGLDGLTAMTAGVPDNGATFSDPYAVVFFPNGSLDCATTMPLTCNATVGDTTNNGVANISRYNCSGGGYDGNEKVFRFDLASVSDVTVTLSNHGTRRLFAFIMQETCNESTGCLAGGTVPVTRRFLSPGTYFVVVDGLDAADDGNFDLELTCTDAVTRVACGDTLTGEATIGASSIEAWSCAWGLTGPENLYAIDVPTPSTLSATLSNKSDPNLNVVIADAASFAPWDPECLVGDTVQADLVGAAPGRYIVAVDGAAGAAGSYDLTVECLRNLACPSPVPLDPFDLTPVVGDTTGKPNTVDAYSCTASAFGPPGNTAGFDGGEDIYQINLATQTSISFLFTPDNPDMRLFILDDCYEGACVMAGGCATDLGPGTYYLVVDGLNGASGKYAITPIIYPQMTYGDWTSCPECVNGCGQSPEDVRLTRWSFDSANYCGTDCDFSLFVVADCGSEMHLPLFDVETGHIEIFDVLRGGQVDLTVNNDAPLPSCAFADAGSQVGWEDSGCTAIPCPTADCGGGSDCRTDNATMDLAFAGAPSICGVYRVDFINMGGFAWDVFANCTGSQLEQFYLFPDLCSALSNYRPLPELGISQVTLDNSQCGAMTVTGSFTVENTGCAPVVDAEVIIEQAPPAAANPTSFFVTIDGGGEVVVPFSYVTTSNPVSIRVSVDPTNGVVECSESQGSTVGCGRVSVRDRSVELSACGCAVNATPARVGNSLRAVRNGTNVDFNWTALVADSISLHRIFKDGDPMLPLLTRQRVIDISATAMTATDIDGVTLPPTPLAHYQVIGVSCFGDLEGPY